MCTNKDYCEALVIEVRPPKELREKHRLLRCLGKFIKQCKNTWMATARGKYGLDTEMAETFFYEGLYTLREHYLEEKFTPHEDKSICRYVIVAAGFQVLKYFRSIKKEPPKVDLDEADKVGDTASPETELIDKECAKILEDCFDSLSELDKEVIRLWVEGKSLIEIGEILFPHLKNPANSARQHLFKAKRRLRACMETHPLNDGSCFES